MNPLLFPEVSSVVFDYIPTSYLYNCRLVCHYWNEEANSKLRTRLVITFNSIVEVEEYDEMCQNSSRIDTSVQSLHPLSNFKFLGNWSANPWQESLQSFFNNTNQFITSLDLRASGWSLWDYGIFFSEVNLPNLTNLSFECPAHHRQKELLSICYLQQPSIPQVRLSSLKSLEISELTHRFTPWVCKLIESNRNLKTLVLKEPRIIRSLPSAILESLMNENCIRRLQRLHLDYYLTNPHLILITKRFPYLQLKSLSFALLSSVQPRLMYSFLKSCANTLTHLQLEYEYIWEKMSLDRFQFPPLENLRHLSVKFLKGSLSSLVMNVNSPQLRSLTLSAFESVENRESCFVSQFCSLEQLSIVSSPRCNFYIDEIRTLFPTLKSLKLQGQLTNEILHSIITNLKSLESMYLSPQRNYFSDEGLIGNSCGVVQNAELEESSEHCVGIPCICKLKALTALYLDINPKLSDNLVDGLGHCQNLKTLSLKSPKFTDLSLLALVDKLPLEKLTFHGGQISPDSIAKAVEKIPDCEVQEITTFDVRIILHSRDNVITCRVI